MRSIHKTNIIFDFVSEDYITKIAELVMISNLIFRFESFPNIFFQLTFAQ